MFEAKGIREDPKAMKRFVNSYRLMLDFYGMTLVNERTGEVARNTKNYEDQYENLEESSHNWLRVTRILKSLGEMELEHYKKPLLEHIIREMWRGHLRPCFRSLKDYWIPVVKSVEERGTLMAWLKSPPQPKEIKCPAETEKKKAEAEKAKAENEKDTTECEKGDTADVDSKANDPKARLAAFLRELLSNPDDATLRSLKPEILDQLDKDVQIALRNCGFCADDAGYVHAQHTNR